MESQAVMAVVSVLILVSLFSLVVFVLSGFALHS
jgi:hypothetical protein